MGECLNDLSYDQLGNLSEEVDNSLKAIRERKVGSFFLSSLVYILSRVLSLSVFGHYKRKESKNVFFAETIHDPFPPLPRW